jgi:hypothetical protein
MRVVKAAKYKLLAGHYHQLTSCLQLNSFIAWLLYVKSLIIHAIRYNLSSIFSSVTPNSSQKRDL